MSRLFEELSQDELRSLILEVSDKRRKASPKSWDDIIDEFDIECSNDTIRKVAVGIELAQNAGMKFDIFDDESRQYVERQKVYDTQKNFRQDLREFSRTELICERIKEAVKDLPEIIFCFEPYKPNKVKKDLVVGFGDFHFGADFNTYGMKGEVINHYDSKVFSDRMSQLATHISHVCKKEKPDQVTLMLVGDLVDGMLRNSQLQRLEFGVIESSMRLAETLVAWIIALEDLIRLPIRVYGVRGNHGEIRPLGSKAGQFSEENIERFIMHELFYRFEKSEYVKVACNDAPMMQNVDVCGYKFVLTHGQNVKYDEMAKDYVNLYHTPIDVFLVGHIHAAQTFTSGVLGDTNVHVECVPSICGVDPYAQSRGYASKAGATLILMEEGYGRRCVYPIVLK